MKKMIVSDYDGTFYRNEKELKENIELINAYRANGNLFVIATGRAYTSFMTEQDKHKVPYDYLILSGGMVLDKDHNVLYYEDIKEETTTNLKALIDKYSKFITHFKYVGLKDSGENIIYPLTKIAMRFSDLLKGYEFSNQALNLYKDINCYILSVPSGNYVEIISSKTNKGVALKYLQDHLKLDADVIFTIGDSSNDYEMIELYNGYVVDTAQPDLKSHGFRVSSIKELTQK
ncbi:MAG TPA: HAD-IIB family hydrolase [Acholeplasma sp.]|nr:HAD-IIB family hydrolase [Acholeplasma sp.]